MYIAPLTYYRSIVGRGRSWWSTRLEQGRGGGG